MAKQRFRILVVDDEPDIRKLIGQILSDHDYLVTEVHDAVAARTAVRLESFDAILLDIWMPGIDGITLLKEWREASMNTPVVMMSAHGSIDAAVEATQQGAVDFLEKPFATGRLIVTIRNAVTSKHASVTTVEPEHDPKAVQTELIGSSPAIKALRNRISEVSRHSANVLLVGEAGSGRITAARLIHTARSASDESFATLDWLIDPTNQRVSLEAIIAKASNGTLLIPALETYDGFSQTRLLGLLNKIDSLRAASDQTLPAIVTTASPQVYGKLESGELRSDVYHSLSEVIIEVPPLRQHLEDIPELVGWFVARFSQDEQLPYRLMSTAALNVLRNHEWRGNIRELKNVLRQTILSSSGEMISGTDVEMHIRQIDEQISAEEPSFELTELEMRLPFRNAKDQFERKYLLYNLTKSRSYVEMAENTGLHRSSLFRKLKEHGIEVEPSSELNNQDDGDSA